MNVIRIDHRLDARPTQYRVGRITLTPRECEVLGLAHLRNRDIAIELGCAVGTVKIHWTRIFSKLRASTRTEAYQIWCEMRDERRAA